MHFMKNVIVLASEERTFPEVIIRFTNESGRKDDASHKRAN